MNDHYEDFLIREMTEGPVRWCKKCECDAEDCVCNPYIDEIDPDSLDYSRGVKIVKSDDGKLHFRPKVTGVHNPGSDVSVPAEPGSPSIFPVPVLAEPNTGDSLRETSKTEGGEARESTRGDRSESSDESLAIDGHSRDGGFISDIGGNVIPDRIEANEDWHVPEGFTEESFREFIAEIERGAESNAYTADEAETRRKEWQE